MTDGELSTLFLRSLVASEGLAPATQERYAYVVSAWHTYLVGRGTSLRDAGPEDAAAWFAELRRRYSTAYQAQLLATLRHYYRWLIRAGYADRDPFAAIRAPKVANRVRPWLSQEETARLLAVPVDPEDPAELRDRALVYLLYSSGLRQAEARALRPGDILWEESSILVQHGKGGQTRVGYLAPDAAKALRAWMDYGRPQWVGGDGIAAPVFCNRRGQELTRAGVIYIVTRWCERAGLSRRVTPHEIRKTAATHLREAGADLETVRQFLGHANLKTTQTYLGSFGPAERRAVANFHPINHLLEAADGR